MIDAVPVVDDQQHDGRPVATDHTSNLGFSVIK